MNTRERGITPQYLLQLPSLFGTQFLFPVGTLSASSQHKKGNLRPLEIPKGSGISWVSDMMAHTIRELLSKAFEGFVVVLFHFGVFVVCCSFYFVSFCFVFVKNFSFQSLPSRLGRSCVDPTTTTTGTSANANWFKEEKNPPLPLTQFCTKAGRDPLS